MILATNNEGKIIEIKKIFGEKDIYSLKEKGIFIEVEEDADTAYGNALKKAKEIYLIAKEPVIADDSGLYIDILEGWPGVKTHRFLGDSASDAERNDAILEAMSKYQGDSRAAKVGCTVVYYDGGKIVTGEGVLNGRIASEKKGINGFGFDEIFELENGLTLAELSIAEKNKISARYLALMDLKQKLTVIGNSSN